VIDQSILEQCDERRLGRRVRELRDAQGLSRRELSELIGCHIQTVLRLERGTMEMSERWLRRLAAGLGVPPAKLFEELGDDHVGD
jgi:transcriptional regulator with XRE-family HTH domain